MSGLVARRQRAGMVRMGVFLPYETLGMEWDEMMEYVLITRPLLQLTANQAGT